MEVPYFLSKYDPDPLRFYLTTTAPKTRDTELSWEDFIERNNNELVATWGNLANARGYSGPPEGTRVPMPSFAYKRFDGHVPRAERAGRRGPGTPGKSRGWLRDRRRAL
jgi:methionyl-tRNA synthetase